MISRKNVKEALHLLVWALGFGDYVEDAEEQDAEEQDPRKE